MYIAISGNLGSGKTTIAKGLARQFHCPTYPQKPYDESYIADLFEQPERWTFEAQASFLIHKYNEIRMGLATRKLFILDRTIYEDVEVFTRKFHDDGVIDDRSMDLLEKIYRNLLPNLLPPALIVWCACPPDVCVERVAQRPRKYQASYPNDHLTKLDNRLAVWMRTITEVPVLRIDTVAVDFRDGEALRHLAFQIDEFMRRPQADEQADLFSVTDAPSAISSQSYPLIELVNQPQHAQRLFFGSLITPRTVYLAAPFTSRAKPRKLTTSAQQSLFPGDDYIENITGAYRRHLLGLSRAIEGHGYRVLLPHRDINAWGRKAYPPSEIANKCIDAVAGCDYFVGLIAESFGSHLELGVALGMSKPILLLFVDTIPTSFFGRGVLESGRVTTLRARNIPQLVSKLKKDDMLLSI